MTDASNQVSQRYGRIFDIPIKQPTKSIDSTRIFTLSTQQQEVQSCIQGFVMYWMSASHRVEYNHAFELAVQKANLYKVPLLVVFCVVGGYPNASYRHYAFMLQGLKQLLQRVENRGSYLICIHGRPKDVIVQISMTCNVKVLIFDRAYLKVPRQWREEIVSVLRGRKNIVEVETDSVVPLQVVSHQHEDSAANYRRKIIRQLEDYLVPLLPTDIQFQVEGSTLKDIFNNYIFSSQIDFKDLIDLKNLQVDEILNVIDTNKSVQEVKKFKGGYDEALNRLSLFLDQKLERYGDRDCRYNVLEESCSNLSPYFHYGQISQLYVAIRVLQQAQEKNPGKGRFLDELIVRRELSLNYVWYNKDTYESFEALPQWARQSLDMHRGDVREHVYGIEDLEKGNTHDKYWNAAQLEMVVDGKMHNYLRMYWAKKILEWTKSPEEAIYIAIYLNDKYELDGRGEAGYVGVMWSIGGLHDRPFPERNIFGQVRYMNNNGLRQKIQGLEELCQKYVPSKGKRQANQNKNIADMFKKAKQSQ